MRIPEEACTCLLGYRIQRDAVDPDRWHVIEPDGRCVLAVFEGLQAAERFIVMRELRALESRPRHPAW